MINIAFNSLFKTARNFSLLFIALILLIFFSVALKIYSYTPPQSTVFFDRNGNVVYELYKDEHRIYASIDEFPKYLKEATVAIEDERFYKHPGIDLIAIVRATKSTIIDKKLQGGSTITQQYVKNAFLNGEKSLKRKAEEAILAVVLESTMTKDKILERYLNEVSYGGIYYGAKTAARHYFDKELSQLTLSEAAFLASLPKAPTTLSSQDNYQESKNRQETVLRKMHQLGYISDEQLNKAIEEKLEFIYKSPEFKAPHFSMMIAQSLKEKYGQEKVEQGGLKVFTTIDLSLQDRVEKNIADEINNLKGYRVSNGAAVVIQPTSGDILALAGSKDYYSQEIDGTYNVILSRRQPGSTFKPILYSLAFEKGYTPATVLLDVDTTYITETEKYRPVNYDGKFHGPVSIRTALANSYNVPATRMNAVLGTNELIDQAKKLGIDYIEENNAGISLSLGGYEIRPIDLAQAYSVFANQGNYIPLSSITSIKDGNNKEMFKRKDTKPQQVITPEVSYLISDILSDNKARTAAFGPNSLLNIENHKVAVKTGTSNNTRDNWAVGYNPDYLVLTWVGNNDNTPMSRVASGITGATPIWHNIMAYLLKDKQSTWYDKPGTVITADVEATTGQKYCDKGKKQSELFIQGSQPTECAKVTTSQKYLLTEKTDDGERNIELTSKDDFEQFKSNPIEFINSHKDIFMADEKPAEFVTIEERYEIKDPLEVKTGQKNVINLTGSYHSS